MSAEFRSILLVEDNRADAVLLEHMLRQVQSVSFKVTWVDRLEKALARFPGEAFDAILLDLSLPDSRGIETLDRLLAVTKSTPIVILTGVEDEDLGIRSIREGAQDYLVKGTVNGAIVARVIQYAIDRRRAEETLREAQKREIEAVAAASTAQVARDTINAMSEGVILLDMSGRILSVNPAMETLAGYRSAAVLGQNLADFLPALVAGNDLEAVRVALGQWMQGVAAELAPFTLCTTDGRQAPVIPAAAFVRGTDGQPASIVLTLRDISQLVGARRAMEESERKYRELVESANSIIMRRTRDGHVTFFNEYAQKFFGYSEQEILGRHVVGTIVPEIDSEGRALAELIEEVGRNPEAHGSSENENVCRDGRRVWIQWTNRALRNAFGEVAEILCVGNDATVRKRAEEDRLRYQQRLRWLADRLVTTEEQERRRLSRSLHDTVIQSLSLSSIKLGAIQADLGKAGLPDELARVGIVREIIGDAIRQSRLLMSDLTPPMLYELGLVSALDDLARRLQEQHGVRISVEDDEQPESLDQALRALLFESGRELITNALKHAGASQIRVTIKRSPEAIRLCVEDNGKGFAPAVSPPSGDGIAGGFGLFSIRERVGGLGGRVEILSRPGSGASVTLVVPLRQKSESSEVT